MAEPAYTLALPEREDGRRWPAQGQWTYEDYLRLPRFPETGQRYEVIRGVLYVSATPTVSHQFAVARFSFGLQSFVNPRGLGMVLFAPFDIKLPREIGNPVEPDILFIRAGHPLAAEDAFFAGTPDLVAEVLSPSTRRVDLRIKFDAYQDAGVPEYWLLDPRARTLTVYSLDQRKYRQIGRGGQGEIVESAVLPGFSVAVDDIFLRP